MSKKSGGKSTSTPLGKKVWASAIIFGLIGQIAWVVENMFFAKFGQDLFDTSGELYYTVTTLMVVLSAITATVTTIFAGGLVDKLGKRKPFITIGYIFWGITIMLFAAIPINSKADAWGIITALVVLDCVMTFCGSTANDAAFNAWITDVTDVTNRGKVNASLNILPVIATVLVFGIGMFTYDSGSIVNGVKVSIFDRNPMMIKSFFIIIGVLPILGGLLSTFLLKDSPSIVKGQNKHYLKNTFYGFKPEVVKSNKMLYVTLITLCLLGIAQQTFLSYLMNFIEKTLGINDYIIPLAVIILLGAIMTGVIGAIFDKVGRKHFYMPLLITVVVGAIVVYCMKFMPKSAYLPVLIIAGVVLLGAMLTLSSALQSSFQDYIPKGCEGRFQGVRMCFTVLIPMGLGIGIAQAVGMNSHTSEEAAQVSPPFELFLAAAIIVAVAVIPMIFVIKDADRLRSSLLASKNNEELACEPAENINAIDNETGSQND